MMNRTIQRMTVTAATLMLGMIISGCDEPALPTTDIALNPDALLSNLTHGEVKGLHRMLRDIKTSGDIMKDRTPSGHVIRAITSVDTCPQVDDAWTDPWVCYTTLTGVFRLKNRTQTSTGVNGGNVTITADAAGDLVKYEEQVVYQWTPGVNQLRVSIRYPASSAVNDTRNWGVYNMKGVSATSITTQSASDSFGLNVSTAGSLGLSVSVDKTTFASTSKVRVTIAGNPYWANEGMFEFKREPFGESRFTVGMDWLTNALADYNEQVIQDFAQCNGQYKHTGSFTVAQEKSNLANSTVKGAVGYTSGQTVTCKSSSQALAAHLHFRAQNAFALCDANLLNCPGGSEPVGERFRANYKVQDLLNGNCKRFYDVGFWAAVSWNMSLVASNGQNGGGFDLGSGVSLQDLTDPTYPETFACN